MPGNDREISLREIGPGFVGALRAWSTYEANKVAIAAGRIVDGAVVQKAAVARLYLAKLGLRPPLRPITETEASQLEAIITFRGFIHNQYKALNLDPNSVSAIQPHNDFVANSDAAIPTILGANHDGIDYLRTALMFDEGEAGGRQYARWPTVTPFTGSDVARQALVTTEFSALSIDGIAVSLQREQSTARAPAANATYGSINLLSVDVGGGHELMALPPEAAEDEPIYGSLAHLQVLPDVQPTYDSTSSPLVPNDPAFDPAVAPIDTTLPPPPAPWEGEPVVPVDTSGALLPPGWDGVPSP